MKSEEKWIKHLYNRAGFGLNYPIFKSTLSVNEHVADLFANSARIEPIQLVSKDMLPHKDWNKIPAHQKKVLQKKSQELVLKLNEVWIQQLCKSQAVLREKMTLFWHGHFACRTSNPVFAQDLNNILRINALGNFKTLLIEVSKSAAMLEFLNNQQNRKEHPNENFAREVMELFTLGRGNYTENDIKEGARAFTGWSYNRLGQFEFKENHHDEGSKLFLGKKGNFHGEDILQMLLDKKETAQFICRKIYAFFVDEVIDENRVLTLANEFYASGYAIEPLLKGMFTASWFYDAAHIGSKIKSPIELLIGLNRTFHIMYEDPKVLMHFQRVLGQVLFYPPNVSGWAGGKNWIDSSTLLFRLRLPSMVLNGGIIDQFPKDEAENYHFMMEEQKTEKEKQSVQHRIKAMPNWEYFCSQFGSLLTKNDLINFLLPKTPVQGILDVLPEVNRGNIKDIAIELVSLPEYQMI